MLMDYPGYHWAQHLAIFAMSGTHNICQIESLPATATQIKHATQRDSILSRVLRCTKSGWPDSFSDAFKPYYHRRSKISIEENCLLWASLVILPLSLREQVLQELHHYHFGINNLKAIARSDVWWPGLDKALEDIVSSCSKCQDVKQCTGCTTPSMVLAH